MTKRLLIFNPAARGEKSRRLHRLIAEQAGTEVTLAETRAAGDAQEIAARAVADGFDVVIAAGGDGTINEVVNGLGPHATAALGILPVGTVNVFARELGIPLKARAAWDIILRNRQRTLDLAAAEAADQRRYFVQLAGVGIDATAVLLASWELKKRIGPISYLWAGLQTLLRPHPPVEVVGKDNQVLATGTTVLLGNGRFYGGPFPVFPDARLDDGQLDICVFEQHRYRDMLRYVRGVISGTHTRFPDVRYFQAASVTCRVAPGDAPFELDGENAGQTPVRFMVRQGGLRVVVP